VVKLRYNSGLNVLCGLLLALSFWPAFAAIDTYQFSDADKQVRFQKLTNELRCPKCQNQNLADSNAEISHDLRAKIHLMLEENKSDQDIINYMLERYGDFVLYQPRVSKQTLVLWYAPFLLLCFGIVAIFLIIRLRAKASKLLDAEITNTALAAEQQEKLAQLLQTKSK
jgi:cytochrome c-type biogenesis protein CcmH